MDDVISLHCPLTSRTRNMIRQELLMQIKSNVLFINPMRGGMVKEHELAKNLNAGHLASAVIEVFDCGPYSSHRRKPSVVC